MFFRRTSAKTGLMWDLDFGLQVKRKRSSRNLQQDNAVFVLYPTSPLVLRSHFFLTMSQLIHTRTLLTLSVSHNTWPGKEGLALNYMKPPFLSSALSLAFSQHFQAHEFPIHPGTYPEIAFVLISPKSLFLGMDLSWSQAWLAVKGGITVPEFTGFVSLLSSLAAPSISLGSFYRVAVTWCRNMRQQLWNGDHLSLLINTILHYIHTQRMLVFLAFLRVYCLL